MFIRTVYDTVPEEKNTGDTLVITSKESIAKECKERGIAVIGVEKENEKIWSADFVVDDESVIDDRLKALVFARHTGTAFTAFETDRLKAVEIDEASRGEVLAFIEDLVNEDKSKSDEEKHSCGTSTCDLCEFKDTVCKSHKNRIFTFDKGFLTDEEYLKAYIENQYAFYGFGMWRLIHKETGKLIGLASLNIERGEVLTMGYAIAKDERRTGFAYEACLGVLDYAKDSGFMQIFLRISKTNDISVKLAKKLGFMELNEEEADCIFYKDLI